MCFILTEHMRHISDLIETNPCPGAVENQKTLPEPLDPASPTISTFTFYLSFPSHVCKGLICYLERLLDTSKMFLCEVLYFLKSDIS